jgi:hypothetical protein
MKLQTLFVAALLACGSAVHAADTHDSGKAGATAKADAHQLATEVKGALHKLGAATRHLVHRADAAVHRSGDRNS